MFIVVSFTPFLFSTKLLLYCYQLMMNTSHMDSQIVKHWGGNLEDRPRHLFSLLHHCIYVFFNEKVYILLRMQLSLVACKTLITGYGNSHTKYIGSRTYFTVNQIFSTVSQSISNKLCNCYQLFLCYKTARDFISEVSFYYQATACQKLYNGDWCRTNNVGYLTSILTHMTNKIDDCDPLDITIPL